MVPSRGKKNVTIVIIIHFVAGNNTLVLSPLFPDNLVNPVQKTTQRTLGKYKHCTNYHLLLTHQAQGLATRVWYLAGNQVLNLLYHPLKCRVEGRANEY